MPSDPSRGGRHAFLTAGAFSISKSHQPQLSASIGGAASNGAGGLREILQSSVLYSGVRNQPTQPASTGVSLSQSEWTQDLEPTRDLSV